MKHLQTPTFRNLTSVAICLLLPMNSLLLISVKITRVQLAFLLEHEKDASVLYFQCAWQWIFRTFSSAPHFHSEESHLRPTVLISKPIER